MAELMLVTMLELCAILWQCPAFDPQFTPIFAHLISIVLRRTSL